MAWVSPALAQDSGEYVPPDRGLPGRREGGGTRGNCPQGATPLTALMPASNFGLTTQADPTLYWYIPPDSPPTAEFVLLDEEGNEIYIANLTDLPSGGIIGLQLPLAATDHDTDHGTDAADSLLIEGEDYQWYFSLICNPNNRSSDIFTEGWIQRIDPPRSLTETPQGQTDGDRAAAYAASGLWYDALSALLSPVPDTPAQPSAEAVWQTLLQSVDLESLVDQPRLPCCEG